jgi:predicted RNase H-like HicB family nuclease
MSTAEALREGTQSGTWSAAAWEHFEHEAAIECHALICPEQKDGGFSIHCINLPGVISEGETVDEAIDNITDAFRETISYYREAGQRIPWKNRVATELPPDSRELAILVRM